MSCDSHILLDRRFLDAPCQVVQFRLENHMTIFAGAYGINASATLPAALVDYIQMGLRAVEDDRGTRHRFETNSFVLESWDSGAFSESGWQLDADGVCNLAGDPLFDGELLSRAKQVCLVRKSLKDGLMNILSNSRGTFALVNYEISLHKLILTTDHIGLRPIYYAIQDGVLVFSTALRILENMPWLQRSVSLQGIAELCAFSFPLADRTPYAEVSVIRECEVILLENEEMSRQRYFDWSERSLSNLEPTQSFSSAQLYRLFEEAVAMRAGDDRSVYSFLSGGMDSRAIAAMLLNMNRYIEALNFSYKASQDQFYAQQFAQEVASHLILHCMEGRGDYLNYSALAVEAIADLEKSQLIQVDRPQCIWSGDGGSVGLGHVYMNEEMLDIADQKGLIEAGRYFLRFNRIELTTKVMSPLISCDIQKGLYDAVLGEMNRYPRRERGRQIYLFLLFNDQRRHLFKHFETIDQHGVELITPFFDSKFLKAIAAMPIRQGIYHRLYSEWFEFLPEVARRTPWQTYPGHVPCPIKSEETGSYQWAKTHRRASIGERFGVARRILRAFRAARGLGVFSTTRVALVVIMQALGLRNSEYLAVILEKYATHAMRGSKPASRG